MNQNAPQPGFELPPLPSEAGFDQSGQTHEAPASPELASAPPASQPIPASPIPQAPHALAQLPFADPVAPPPAPLVATPATADDNDLIEKEWVVKAKQIVAATREDPHAQNRELSKIKADYLKKRYGKDIRVDES